MKFYGREKEIEILRHERALSHASARFTVVTGRRRIGKTELIDRALNDGTDDYLYLLFGRKSEKALTQELKESAEEQLGDRLPPLGNPERLSQLVRQIFDAARDRPLTVVMDEFQEMDVVNPGCLAFPRGGPHCPFAGIRRRLRDVFLDSQCDCLGTYALQ